MSVRWRKDRKRWMVDIKYQHGDGTIDRIRELCRTKRGAERREREIVGALEEGTWNIKEVEEKIEQPTLRVFAEEFMSTYAKVNNKPSEVASKLGILDRYLFPHFGKKKLSQIKVREIERFKAALLGRELSPKTVNNALAVLSKILRYAEEIEILEKAPRSRLLRVPKPSFDFLDFDEAEQLMEAATYNPEWYAMIFVALRTGVRYGELCELRWYDVDLKNGRLVVRRSYYKGHVTTPKGGRAREIPLSKQTLSLLRGHRHLKGELVFCKQDGGRHIHRRSDVAIKRCARRANLRSIGWHMLRHSFASHLVMRGIPLKTVQELLGHSTMEMTMRYAHLSPEVKRDAVAVLDSPGANQGHHRGTKREIKG